MLKKITEYINYRLNARGRHGVHSPFVYDFVDKCLSQKVPKDIWKEFKKYKNEFDKSGEVIEIDDFGAGSKKLDASKRRVRDISKVSGSGKKFGKLLYKISAHYKSKSVLELGTSLGYGTFMLAKGNPLNSTITVEGCENTAKKAQDKHRKYEITNSSFRVGKFEDFLNTYQGEKFDLVFIDGDHRGESLLSILELLDPFTHEETIFLLDDIRWSTDMKKAWIQIVGFENYHLTMDLFRMGIVMKRPYQAKEHFIIKF